MSSFAKPGFFARRREMHSFLARFPIYLAALLAFEIIECQGGSWSSSSLAAEFTPDGRLRILKNLLTDEQIVFANAEEFSFNVNGEEIRAEDCRFDSVLETAAGPEVTYIHPEFEIRVTYGLEKDAHFIQKQVVLRHLGTETFEISRCSVHRWELGADSGQLIPFQHGQCVTYFMRMQRGGFLWGVQCPFEEVPPEGARMMGLTYPVGLIFDPGSSYRMEVAYWGVYEQTGRFAPKVPERIKESYLSQVAPDAGESEAMLGMVRRVSQPARSGPTVVFNGYQGGMSFGDYGDPDGLQQAEYDIETLRIVEAVLGSCFVQPGAPWFGAYRQATVLTPESKAIPVPPAREKLTKWIGQSGMKPMGWSSVKAIHGWVLPRLGPYCQNHLKWQGNPSENCPANPEFLRWFAQVLKRDLENGFQGFTSDEPGPTNPRFYFECQRTDHGHTPGDVSYPYFYWERWLFRQLREAFGQSFELQGQRPQMDAGIWHATYLNSLFTLEESPGKSADLIRRWARIRRHYTFTPSYMDQLMVQPGMDDTDYLMLSILAVSSNYLFVAPATPETLSIHTRGMREQNNRLMAAGWRSFPENQRSRVRSWLDWARRHGKFMSHVFDLPGWPGEGGPDGYVRVLNGRGFAFLFNSTRFQQLIRMPLDKSVGLDAETSYSLKQLHPQEGSDLELCKSEARYVLEPRSAYLVQIDPAEKR